MKPEERISERLFVGIQSLVTLSVSPGPDLES
jgi:hypothetical protein